MSISELSVVFILLMFAGLLAGCESALTSLSRLLIEEIEIIEAFSYNFTPASKKEIKKIIYQHFDLIVSEWSKHFLNNGKDA